MKRSLLLSRDEKSLEQIRKNSLAGLYACAGDLHAATKIASLEGDILHVCEVQQGISIISRIIGLKGMDNETKAILEDDSVSELIKSIYCLAIFRFGQLGILIPFVKSRPEMLEIFLNDGLDGYEDSEIVELAITVGNDAFASKCLKILTQDDFIYPSLVQKLLTSFPAIELTSTMKKMLLKAAISGTQSNEDVTLSELLIGKDLTETERKRYAHNRFRELLDSSTQDEAIQYVWNELGRKLTKHERVLLRKDALFTLEVRTKK